MDAAAVLGHWTRSRNRPSDAQSIAAGLENYRGDFNADGTSDVLWYRQGDGGTEVWIISNAHWAGSVYVGPHPSWSKSPIPAGCHPTVAHGRRRQAKKLQRPTSFLQRATTKREPRGRSIFATGRRKNGTGPGACPPRGMPLVFQWANRSEPIGQADRAGCQPNFIRAQPVDNVDRQLELGMLHVYGSIAARYRCNQERANVRSPQFASRSHARIHRMLKLRLSKT